MTDALAKLLLVEDDPGKRYTIARQLRLARFEVVEAATGAEGLARARDNPDIVILDLKLPDIDGFEVCRRLRADPVTAPVLVLELSARYMTGADRVRGLEEGADAYLVHPVEADELVATVRALLRLRQAERDRQRLSLEVEASELRYRTVTETASVGLLLLDHEGRCTFMNGAAESVVGRSAQEIYGKIFHDIIHSTRPDGSRYPASECPVYDVAVHGGRLQRHRDTIIRPDGKVVQVELSACSIKRDAPASGAVVEIKDISELARAELQRQLFLGALGHDLRNPLQSISIGVDLLARVATLGGREREILERMSRSSGRMQRLIDQMLLASRSFVDAIPIAPVPTDLAELCAGVIRETALREPTRKIELFDELRVSVAVDPDLISQVIDNLLANAIRHGRGDITMTLRREENAFHLALHNFGPAIPEAHLPTLFDPFRRADGGLGGVGLGLYIVHEIVRAHSGTVSVSSSEGEGTTFTTRIPFLPADTV